MKLIVRDPSKGYLDTQFWLPKAHCNVEGVKTALSFPINTNKGQQEWLTLFRETDTHLLVPREFWEMDEFTFPIVDCRPVSYESVPISSRIRLDHLPDINGAPVPTGETVQRDALEALLGNRGGVLQLACGKGKTVIALEYIAQRKVPALIVVDTTQLVEQWKKSIAMFLDVPGGVGMLGDGEFDWNKSVVIATYHTLAQKASLFPEEARRWFGIVIWDEAHHVAAPTFARSADLFYGTRLGLTATPIRDDGMHVVYNFHIGKVLFKDLRQELKPRIYFKWTGLKLDPQDPRVQMATKDKNGELHLGKVAGFFGQWQERLELVINEVKSAADQGRKIIVLSNSVDEIINLLSLWNKQALYTDVAYPTSKDVGSILAPIPMNQKQEKKLLQDIAIARANLSKPSLNAVKRQNIEAAIAHYKAKLDGGEVWRKCEALYKKRQREFLKNSLKAPSTAGLMIYKVSPAERSHMLKTKQVTFAISKYGREGLDEPTLDTIIVLEPLSSRNALQQLMGRVLRKKAGKRDPVVVFLEDDIGPMIGMCRKLRSHLRSWPVDEGGPYEFELIDNPSSKGDRSWKNSRGYGS